MNGLRNFRFQQVPLSRTVVFASFSGLPMIDCYSVCSSIVGGNCLEFGQDQHDVGLFIARDRRHELQCNCGDSMSGSPRSNGVWPSPSLFVNSQTTLSMSKTSEGNYSQPNKLPSHLFVSRYFMEIRGSIDFRALVTNKQQVTIRVQRAASFFGSKAGPLRAHNWIIK